MVDNNTEELVAPRRPDHKRRVAAQQAKLVFGAKSSKLRDLSKATTCTGARDAHMGRGKRTQAK